MSQHVSEARMEEGGGQHSESLSGVSRAWAKYLYYVRVHTQTHTPALSLPNLNTYAQTHNVNTSLWHTLKLFPCNYKVNVDS